MLWRKPPWHQTVHDAAFIIKQQTPITDLGSYTRSPFPIDAHIHVAGFLLNADVRKPKHEVQISNHIGSLRMLGDLTKYSPFLTHATIQEQDLQSGMSLIVLDTSVLHFGRIDLYDELLDTIAKWSGNSVAELQKTTSTNFAALDAELAAAFFSDNRTVAATLEALDESPEPKIVDKSPSSRAGMIQGNLRSREDRLFMTTDGSGTIFDLSIQEMASIFICTIRKIHDKGRTPLVAIRQAPLLFSTLATGRPRLGIGRALADMTLPEFELYFSSWFYGRRRE
ncbi:hypothetical protein E4U37_008246 [Claviceps purpurea]|nr:hypothetical protein E4U37_008246 [Claviceps purpurea]